MGSSPERSGGRAPWHGGWVAVLSRPVRLPPAMSISVVVVNPEEPVPSRWQYSCLGHIPGVPLPLLSTLFPQARPVSVCTRCVGSLLAFLKPLAVTIVSMVAVFLLRWSSCLRACFLVLCKMQDRSYCSHSHTAFCDWTGPSPCPSFEICLTPPKFFQFFDSFHCSCPLLQRDEPQHPPWYILS